MSRTILGTTTRTVTQAGKVTLTIKLKGKAARKLRRKRSFKAQLTTVFTPVAGSPGPRISRTVTVKRR